MREMKKILILVAAIAMSVSAFAQEMPLNESSASDLQGRFKAGLEIPLGEKWGFAWSEQLRTKDSFRSIDKILSSVSFDYTPWKFLEVGSEYALVNEKKGDDWRTKHRWNIDITEKLTAGRFELSLRERVRMEFRGYSANKYEDPNPFTTFRTRLKAAYKNPSRWKPYAYVEVYATLNATKPVANYLIDPIDRDNYCNRVRLVFGSEMKINEKQKMDFHYMLNLNRSYKSKYDAATGNLQSWALEKVCAHVICVDYKFSL